MFCAFVLTGAVAMAPPAKAAAQRAAVARSIRRQSRRYRLSPGPGISLVLSTLTGCWQLAAALMQNPTPTSKVERNVATHMSGDVRRSAFPSFLTREKTECGGRAGHRTWNVKCFLVSTTCRLVKALWATENKAYFSPGCQSYKANNQTCLKRECGRGCWCHGNPGYHWV